MNLKPQYKATTKDGFRIIGIKGKEWAAELERMFPSMDITITVQKWKKQRSNEQNAYYWGVVIPKVRQGLKDIGYIIDNDLTHDFLKTKFTKGQDIVSKLTGEVEIIGHSTSGLSTSEMMDYFAQIQQWAAEFLGIQIPDPNEQTTLFE